MGVTRPLPFRSVCPWLALGLAYGAGCQDYNVQRHGSTDTFAQEGGDVPVDVLWIIDSSATMGDEQAAIAGQMAGFVEELSRSGIDFQIGVTTADLAHEGGGLVGPLLTADTPDLVGQLQDQATVGVLGDRHEAPLDAFVLATSEPMLSSSNVGLVRADTAFHVIVLADEDDQSAQSVGSYISHLEQVNGGDRGSVSAIAGSLPAGCHSQLAEAEPAPRLDEAARMSGGAFFSICEPEPGDVLASLGVQLSGLVDSFILSAVPEVDTLEVRVDGMAIYQRPTDGWQYEPADNAVVFDGLAVPRSGQDIVIKYLELVGGDD